MFHDAKLSSDISSLLELMRSNRESHKPLTHESGNFKRTGGYHFLSAAKAAKTTAAAADGADGCDLATCSHSSCYSTFSSIVTVTCPAL